MQRKTIPTKTETKTGAKAAKTVGLRPFAGFNYYVYSGSKVSSLEDKTEELAALAKEYGGRALFVYYDGWQGSHHIIPVKWDEERAEKLLALFPEKVTSGIVCTFPDTKKALECFKSMDQLEFVDSIFIPISDVDLLEDPEANLKIMIVYFEAD